MLPIWRIMEKGSLSPLISCTSWCLVMTPSTGLRLSVNFQEGSWHEECGFGALATPAGVRDRRTHLEAVPQDGKTGGSSLTGISFIWAEPDQLFLIKTHFATCSNVSRSSTCAYVQRKLSDVPSTGHTYKLSTWLAAARQVTWRGCAWPEAGFSVKASVENHANDTITSMRLCSSKVCLVGILSLMVILIIMQCFDFPYFFILHYKW